MRSKLQTWTDFPVFPVMGEELGTNNTFIIDLSKDNEALNQIDLVDSQDFCRYMDGLRESQKKKYALGGYLENRIIYTRSNVFATDSSLFRNIHLGIDIWTLAGSRVYCPLDGVIHSFKDNAGFGNYGPTAILEHVLRGKKVYSLYGHLAKADLDHLYPGKSLGAGDVLGHLGEEQENGNWPPHLHFQLIQDMEGFIGDYPGVCRESEMDHYAQNCPNPISWLNCKMLLSKYNSLL